MNGTATHPVPERIIVAIVRQAIDWRVDYREHGQGYSMVFGQFWMVNEFVRETLPPEQREYTVLGLSVDDAIGLDEADDEAWQRPGKYEQLFSSLSPALQEYVVQYLCERMWNHDLWDEGLRDALDSLTAQSADATGLAGGFVNGGRG